MKIALVYPPPWKLYAVPRICLATLTASLRKERHDVVQRDLSIEARNRLLLSRDFLGECLDKTKRTFKSLSSRRSLTHDEQKRYYGAARWAALGDRLIETVPPKAASLLGQGVLDGARQNELRSLLAKMQSLVSAAFYPSEWDDYRYCSSFSAFSSSQILEAIRHTEDNIFYSYFRDEVVPSLTGSGTEMLGISIGAEESVIPGLTLASLVKEASPATHVVVGGFHFTKVLDSLRKARSLFDVVDTFVVFEGETAVVKLAAALRDGTGLDRVPNLVYLDDDRIRVNEPFHVEDFDNIPVPDFDGLPMDEYPGLPIETNRGCYWDKCAFCYHTYRSTRYSEEDFIDVPNFRMRSIERLPTENLHMIGMRLTRECLRVVLLSGPIR